MNYYNVGKMQTLSAQLSWSHYCELLPIESLDEISYYVMITEEQNLSVRQLRQFEPLKIRTTFSK